MEIKDWLNIIAILSSPIVALWVSSILEKRREKKQLKRNLFGILVTSRHSAAFSENAVMAFNTIDIIFDDVPQVRKLWREYFDLLCNNSLNDEIGHKQRNIKFIELIYSMAKSLGFNITHLDLDRIYYPQGLADQAVRNAQIQEECLRVLKNTYALQTKPNKNLLQSQ